MDGDTVLEGVTVLEEDTATSPLDYSGLQLARAIRSTEGLQGRVVEPMILPAQLSLRGWDSVAVDAPTSTTHSVCPTPQPT